MRNIIVCVTDECNLACKYCFAGCNKREINIDKINDKFIEAIPKYVKAIKKTCVDNDYNKTQVIFHGGEPLLIRTENYELLINQLQEFDIDYVMQTNGTIMNENIYEFIMYNGVRLGISIDGPREVHDANRVLKNGKGSYELVQKTLDFLKEKKYNFSCLATITKNSIGNEEIIYNYFNKQELAFDFNPVFSVMESEEQEYLISQNAYAEFVINLFDIWFKSNDKLMIIKFNNIINSMVNGPAVIKSCDCNMNCSDFFVAVDNCGDIYNCSRFVGHEKYILSNVEKKDFSVSCGLKGIVDRHKILLGSDCKDCEIWEFCYGGCPYNAIEKNGNINSKDYFCEGKRKIYKHINKELQKFKR